jgi:hypothetical protein
MVDMIDNNNPNNEWGKHVIEIVLKQWRYQRTFTTRVGGNCHGFTIMETAIGNVYETLLDTQDDPSELVLTDDNGDTLLCTDDDNLGDEWIKKMVVSCRIIDFEPPTINEVRARNGAKPLPDGDRPWTA